MQLFPSRIVSLLGMFLLAILLGCSTDTSNEKAEGASAPRQEQLSLKSPKKSTLPLEPIKTKKAGKELVKLTENNFASKALGAEKDKLVIVDFWAIWCRPCRMLDPIMGELAQEYDGKVIFGKVDLDKNPALSSTHKVRSIPTLLFIKNGEVLDRVTGAVPKSMILDKLNEHI